MKVASFMVPRSKVVTCCPDDKIEIAVKKMLEHDVGSVIVLPQNGDTPSGIVTKTDLIRGWDKGLSETEDTVCAVMGTDFESILDTSPTGVAAEHFENTKHRHAFVVDKYGKYVGIVTAYDIAVETSRDSKAWPYVNRDVLAEKYRVTITH